MAAVRAYIGLGSNLDDPVAQVRRALAALTTLPHSRRVAHSSLYRSRPLGPSDQPDYINAVAAVETELTPEALLAALQGLESTQGRRRDGQRWGPRTLDLDILLFGDTVMASAELVIPHPGLHEREFVLYPLQEIAPGLRLPDGSTLAQWVARCPDNGLVCLDET